MLFEWNNALICRPEICITDTTPIASWYRTPEFSTGHFTPITQGKRHDLPSFPAQREPYPALIRFLANKGPEFITFEGDATRIVRLRREKRLLEWRQLVGFFLTSKLPSGAQRRTSVPIHASCCVPDRREGFPLFVPPNSQHCSDFRDFVGHRYYNGTSVFRSAQYHICSGLDCRNDGRRSVV
jgi:hypothetical protein